MHIGLRLYQGDLSHLNPIMVEFGKKFFKKSAKN